jgi:outer membrane protein OmpA-like peptidoglycan-associated protein
MEPKLRFACNRPMSMRSLLPAAAVALLLAGCASSPLPPSSAPATSGPSATASGVSLSDEQRRLAELFRGTPVVFEMTPEGNLRVEVPEKFCFDKGRAVVKPPLAKVLEKVAPSAKAAGMKAHVLAPSDGRGDSWLARQRAASARDYLIALGVPFTHFVELAPTKDDAIEIIVGKS